MSSSDRHLCCSRTVHNLGEFTSDELQYMQASHTTIATWHEDGFMRYGVAVNGPRIVCQEPRFIQANDGIMSAGRLPAKADTVRPCGQIDCFAVPSSPDRLLCCSRTGHNSVRREFTSDELQFHNASKFWPTSLIVRYFMFHRRRRVTKSQETTHTGRTKCR